MRRREFIAGLGGAMAWSLAVRAQQNGRMRRVGALIAGEADASNTQANVAAFQGGLERLGWSVGSNVRINYRYALGNLERMQVAAKEVVALRPDVIFVQGTALAAALQRETREVPIVFVAVSDPIGSGFVASLRQPGGNLTGFLFYEEGIVGRWLAMLKEISPKLKRAALIGHSSILPYFDRSARPSAAALQIELVPSPHETITDVERIMESFSQSAGGGLAFLPDSVISINRDRVIALAERYRLPAIYASRLIARSGGLMSYDIDIQEMFRQGANYVDRILRGDKPADLPVQAPVKYETIINLKAAKTLGLTVPGLMLVRADEVIE
jgi:putative tryptophan/tyrosine transport system substrate-binding protein